MGALRVATTVLLRHVLPAETSSGGVLKLRVKAPSQYRISTDAPFWIDVVAGSEIVTSTGQERRVDAFGRSRFDRSGRGGRSRTREVRRYRCTVSSRRRSLTVKHRRTRSPPRRSL